VYGRLSFTFVCEIRAVVLHRVSMRFRYTNVQVIYVSNLVLFICVVDCKDHYDSGSRADGVYGISVQGLGDRSVYCDMTGGGRTVLQRRFNGDVDFARGYDDYINGFGDVAGDHWLGLELMHRLTTRPDATNSLLIDVHRYDGTRDYMNYANVWVDDRNSGYMLHLTRTDQDISSPSLAHMLWSDVGLHRNDGWAFTTLDHDVDAKSPGNCAILHGGGGGWWYKACSFIFINGKYNLQAKGGIGVVGVVFKSMQIMHVPIYATNPSMSVITAGDDQCIVVNELSSHIGIGMYSLDIQCRYVQRGYIYNIYIYLFYIFI
jgi:hypothetical protein